MEKTSNSPIKKSTSVKPIATEPVTKAPTSVMPNVSTPVTKAPTSVMPNVSAPNTKAPTSVMPNISAPNTKALTSVMPNISVPNTKAPTSVMPNISAPNTKAPTSVMPNVSAPVAQAPAWVMPVAYPAVKQMEHHEKKNWCKEHMHRYVLVKTHDGYCVDGFVEHIDDEMVCIAVPYCEAQWDRGCPCPYPPIYPYPYYPRRRFVRQAFPLAGLLAISLLPFY